METFKQNYSNKNILIPTHKEYLKRFWKNLKCSEDDEVEGILFSWEEWRWIYFGD